MAGTPDNIRLEIPKHRIAADFGGMIGHLVGASTHATLLQNWPGVITNLFAAAGAIQIKRREGALAWRLLLTSIGEALTEVASQQPPTLMNEQDVDTICKRVEREAADLIIPVDFLDHPWTLPPVELAKKTLLTWLAPPPDSSVPQDLVNLEHRFDAALVLGLHRTIRGDEARYRPLLDLGKDPTGPAWRVLEDWRLYRAWLVSEFRTAPVFDESFAIDQIYVPLNAWHWVEQHPGRDDDQKRVRGVVNLNDEVMAWLRGERGRSRLRLVSGGPGSGKSSAMKALAAHLAEKGNNNHPVDVLLFPLQRLQWRAGIVESVGTTLTAYEDQMRHNPIESDHLRERKIPLLLIFDGLDELTATTQVSEAISATFVRELNTTLRSWQDRPVWVIVTGRDAIFGNVEGPTSVLPGEQFNLLPYHVREHERGLQGPKDYHDPNSLLQIDNRVEAFRKFAEAKGQPSDNLPEMYRNRNLHDVSAQPLLNYFMLTSTPEEISDGNLAKIYSNLFERLHARNRNLQNRPQDVGKPAAGLDQNSFDRAFEAMAVAAWRTGGTRAATWDEVLAEVEREDSYLTLGESKLRDVFDTQMLDRGAQRPFRLAAAFFSRSNQQATGVEFTHKSFGDYLYARRLAKAVASMADQLILAPAVEKEMLGRWERLTSEQRMSREVLRFLELEIEATVDAETLIRRHSVLAPVVERMFREGWRMETETRPRQVEKQCSQMEEALFVAWHAMWRPDNNCRYWKLGEDTWDLLYRAWARQISAHGFRYYSVFVRGWSGADLSEAVVNTMNLSGANLNNANLRNARLIGVDLTAADLVEADLSGSRLYGADLEEADLEEADLSQANLIGASLTDANLVGADLTGAKLSGADLSWANLQNADLEGADLSGADFTEANLDGANFRGADLSGAIFSNASGLSEGV